MVINEKNIECGSSLTTNNSHVGVKCHIEELSVPTDVILKTSRVYPRKMETSAFVRGDNCLYRGTTQSLDTPLQESSTSISCILDKKECNVIVYRTRKYLIILL